MQVIQFIWQDQHLWGQKCKAYWTHETINHFSSNFAKCWPVFTMRCYASAVLAMGLCLFVSVCVCLSVTSRCSTKTAVRRITHTTSQDSPGTLVFWRQRSPRNSTGVTLYEGAKCRWGRSKSATWQITGCISKTVQDTCSFFFLL